MKNNTEEYYRPYQLKLPIEISKIIDMEDPSFMTFEHFIANELSASIEDMFKEINEYIFAKEGVDTDHAYIDGTKIEANANKYTWVWKKSCEKNRGN